MKHSKEVNVIISCILNKHVAAIVVTLRRPDAFLEYG